MRDDDVAAAIQDYLKDSTQENWDFVEDKILEFARDYIVEGYLANINSESVKPSKKHIIKENKSTEYRAAHCITVKDLKDSLISIDPNTKLMADSEDIGEHWPVKVTFNEFGPDYVVIEVLGHEPQESDAQYG